MKNQIGSVGTILVVQLVVLVGLGWGWVLNLMALANFEGSLAEFTILEMLRVVGVVAVPLGTVLGYFF